jgi:LmbE family N-acetylglucosaminyl deacetylase
MNVLAIGAHPDDIEALCAGTLALYAREGARVVMCIATDGRNHPTGEPDQVAALRRTEAQAAAEVIGAELVWLGMPDGALMVDLEKKAAMIEMILAAQPHIIFTHPPDDYHSDHEATSRLVTAAIQAAWAPPASSGLPPLRRPVPVAFCATALGINFVPEDYVDISPVWETKMKMLLQHRSQYLPGPSYFPEDVQEPIDQYYVARLTRVMSEFYGLACGAAYAEAFRWWRAADRILPRRLLP